MTPKPEPIGEPGGADIVGTTRTIRKGSGYWDVTTYPYGGDFHRASLDTAIVIDRIVKAYADGSPAEVEGRTSDRRNLVVKVELLT